MGANLRGHAIPTKHREPCVKDFNDITRSVEFDRVLGPLNYLWYFQLAAVIKQHAPDAKRVLDLGTGPGHLIPCLSRLYPYAYLIGVDLSLPMLQIARSHRRSLEAEATISLIRGDFFQLPFRSHAFDLVTATGILHHVNDLRLFFQEVYRVTAPGGRLIVSAFRRDISTPTRVFSRLHSNWLAFTGSSLEGLESVLKSSWTKREVEDALAQIGFRKVELRARRLRLQIVAVA